MVRLGKALDMKKPLIFDLIGFFTVEGTTLYLWANNVLFFGKIPWIVFLIGTFLVSTQIIHEKIVMPRYRFLQDNYSRIQNVMMEETIHKKYPTETVNWIYVIRKKENYPYLTDEDWELIYKLNGDQQFAYILMLIQFAAVFLFGLLLMYLHLDPFSTH